MLNKPELLWQQFIDDDKNAFNELVRQYFRLLFVYGTKMHDDEELVKDTVQELFIYLWNHRKSLSTTVNPKAYLISSFRRSLYQKIKLGNRLPIDRNSNFESSSFELEVSIEQLIIEKEENKAIAKQLAMSVKNLPPRQKELVYLKYVQGLNRDQIAEIMGISIQTISNINQMAMKKLRVEMMNVVNMIILLSCIIFKS